MCFTAAAPTFTNTGILQASSGGSLTISPGTYGAGTIGTASASGTGSRLNLAGGTLTLGQGENLSAASGGMIVLQTMLSNTGLTFDPLAYGSADAFAVGGGTILGGNIIHSDSLGFIGGAPMNGLQNVTLDGGLSLTGGTTDITGTFAHGTGSTFSTGIGRLQFGLDYTLDNATLKLGASGGTAGALGADTGHTLTLGTNLAIASAVGTIDGPAVVSNTDLASSGGALTIAPTSFINNATVEGTGLTLGTSASHTTLTNNGTITATGGLDILRPDTYAKIGVLHSTGGGTLDLRGGTLTLGAGDQLTADSGSQIVLQTTLNNVGQTFDLANLGAGSFVDNGTITGGTIANASTLILNGTLNNVTLGGLTKLTIQPGDTGTITGTFSAGVGSTLALTNNTSRLVFNTDATLANATLYFGDLYTNFGDLSVSTGHTLTLSSTATFSGAAGIIDGGGTFVNDTTITANAGNNQYFVIDPVTLVNNGTIQATAATNYISLGTSYTTGTTNNGTLQALNGGFMYFGTYGLGYGPPVNTGAITIGPGSQMTFPEGLQQTGGSTLIDGSVFLYTVAPAQPLTIAGGTLSGSGTVAGNVEIDGGTFTPGDGAGGTFAITRESHQAGTGNFTQGSGGTFLEQLGGTAPGQFGALSTSDVTTLAGALDVSLVSGFSPVVGQSFTFLTYGSESGAFSNVVAMDPGYAYNVAYTPTSALLTVTAAPEPSPVFIFGLGTLGLAGLRLRKRWA